ncbi:isocitrate/isopropylmalate dehydrogenase family protein [Streptomyces montanisoli]|uniref:Isocitrate/isopropylmalate dehydrogenase family protein n=1 Tax=Streptomyces montanisoli TaxID=2798581 RepID=A0A940MBB4_9ACTN|nr:isocitrate/isopropylmalate family dehydrogenase [Streptomyces montanisoli]MBP0457316.1 isocitrate/isopropylmalate dehydrogenase family protein [Streptomyces montanisoli]
MTVHDIAVIRGDGIGPELIDAALTVLEKVSDTYGFDVGITEVDAGAGTYERTGTALPPEGLAAVRAAAATLKGPVGLPSVRLPDGTEAGLLGGVLRSGLDLYANVRPIELLPGVHSRLRARPGSIDYVIVRESTEDLYASRAKDVGTATAMADSLRVTRRGCERIARFAFDLARTRSGSRPDRVRRVTCVDKANVLRSMYLFRQVFLEVAEDYPDIQAECLYADAAAQALVMTPEYFDVVVTGDMFGDILSDLGGGTVGGIAMCPSGDVGDGPACFEPLHGSAPSLVGRKKANPTGQVLAVAMMLDHLGERAAARAVREAVRGALDMGTVKVERDGRCDSGPAAAAEAIAREVQPDA